ncbi:MAG TPA: ABATE domain-containing protein [Solirubrobacteraceae bacterium]|nr:ABATE domain-containing protein [Solirubrobacteraceae bacterium]
MVTKRATELRIVGGDLALDLANTLEGRDTPETLVDYAELAAWAGLVGAVDDAEPLTAIAAGQPAAARRALDDVRRLRTTVDGVFRPLAEHDAPPPDALEALAAFAAEAAAHAQLVPHDGGFELSWPADNVRRPLWPIAIAAVDLLRAGPLDRLKACANCPWLFIDRSRNRSRRWCSMDECGVHLKMRRYRARLATGGR